MEWFWITLLCAFSYATADMLTKRLLSGCSARELVVVRFLAPGVLLLPVLVAFPPQQIAAPFWWWLAGLLPLEIFAMWLYMQAIRTSPLSQTLPYLAFTPVFAVLTAWLLLGETVTAKGMAGICLVVAGAWLLNLPNNRTRGGPLHHRLLAAIAHERGSQLMLAVAAIYSLTSVMGKGAMQYVAPLTFGALYFAILGVASLAVFSIGDPGVGRILWRRPAAALLVGAAMAVMALTHFIAINQVEVAYMLTVKRASLLFGILYGALLFGEPRLRANLAWGGLMLAGVALILL